MSQKLEEAAQLIEAAEPGTVHLLQLTDCHIFAEAGARLLGLDTRDSLERVCAAAMQDQDTLTVRALQNAELLLFDMA